MATNFATRYKKDLSTEIIKTKLVRRKSLFQKENRHKEFNKGRQFGLVNVNIQPPRDRELSLLEETGEGRLLRSNTKPNQISCAVAKAREQERLEMLQRYKAEKEVRRLKEQREKPIFKCGRFKPETPAFLPKSSHIPILSKPKEKATKTEVVPPVRVTRSKAKNQLQEPVRLPARSHLSEMVSSSTSKGCSLQTVQHKQKQIYIDKPPPKERKGVQPSVSALTNGRTTRAAAAALSKIPQIPQPAANSSNPPQKRATKRGKQQGRVKNAEATASCAKEAAVTQTLSVTEQNESFLEKENLPALHIPAPAPPKRTRSFAPQNFVFKPLEGLTTYQVKPMTPSRANVFLSPNLCWSPTKTTSKVPEEDAVKQAPQDCVLQKEFSNPELMEEDLQESLSAPELLADNTECVPNETTDAVPFEWAISMQNADLPTNKSSDPSGELQHNVPYFRNLLQRETEKLTSHCLEWDGAAETDIPEDAKDLVRTTVGQTRLLISERFKQFEGLVDNCEFKRGEKETTCEDLDGFWDMVNFQVEDVKKKFENLRKLQENGWQMVDNVQSERPTKKKAAPPRATQTRGAPVERKAAQKRLAAVKAAMRNRMKGEGLITEAPGQEMPTAVEKVTFDGGFFQIESPAKPFPAPGQTLKSISRTSRYMTPRSAIRALLQNCADSCVVRLGTPTVSGAIPPLPDQNPSTDPAGIDLACISEKSNIQTVEEPCAPTEGMAKEATDAPTVTCDRGSLLCDTNDLISVDSWSLEGASVKMEVQEIAEEVKQTTAELGEQGILGSPEEDSQSESICSPTEDLHTPEHKSGPLLGDFSCDDRTLDLQPNLDSSLFFTPLRNKAVACVAALPGNDLIVFSPLSFPKGEQ